MVNRVIRTGILSYAVFLLASPVIAENGVPAYHGSVPGPETPISPLDDAVELGIKRLQALPKFGDPDRDFVMLMREHHQGAIDMSRAYLKHGKDRQMRRLAREIIDGHQKEITRFNAWERQRNKAENKR